VIIVAIIAGALALLIALARHFRRDAPISSDPTMARVARSTPSVRAELPGDDLIDPGRSAWTALDDHQLNRLLRESS
jgi:hypothetical protein